MADANIKKSTPLAGFALFFPSEYGLVSAAGVARDMLRSFPNVRIGLMVGIGGGAPSLKHDIRLGDVVVSVPGHGEGGVFQYDYGKTIQNQKFEYTGFLNQPPRFLRTAVTGLGAKHEVDGHNIEDMIDNVLGTRKRLRKKYKRPDRSTDRLYLSSVVHSLDPEASCVYRGGDDTSKLVMRRERTEEDDNPTIHYGLIASADKLMKDATIRDSLAAERGVLCFEMEAAGLMNHFPCLVIRGICDYSDSHKNKEWQGYAAMAAAAYAKELLCEIPRPKSRLRRRLASTVMRIEKKMDEGAAIKLEIRQEERETRQDEKDNECLKDLRATDPRTDRERIKETKGGLFRDASSWILDHDDFRRWRDCDETRLLWIKGDPGKGTDKKLNNATAVLRGLVYLLAVQHPRLISHIRESYDHAGPKLFEDVNSFYTLSNVLERMLRNESLSRTYIVIDALDECTTDREMLLRFIVEHSAVSDRVKWIVSSRNRPEIEQHLKIDGSGMNLSLEITKNAEQVSRAVGSYIDFKMETLSSLLSDHNLRNLVRDTLREKANGTFLWAALVIKELEKVTATPWRVPQVVEEVPSNLNELYDLMMVQIQQLKDWGLCQLVLSAVTVAYRPLHLTELAIVSGLPKYISENPEVYLGQVQSVAFSHDSKLIASGSTDGTIKIWDVATGHEAHMLEGRSSWVWSVAFSHDSKLIASGSDDKTIKIWDVATGHEVHMLKGHRGSVRSVAFSHGSKRIASGSTDGTIKIWDVATGHEAHMLEGHSSWVLSVAFSHDSKLIASVSSDMTIKIWDVATGHEVHMLKGHRGSVRSVAFSHGSKRIASGSTDGTIKIWDVATGHEAHMLEGHSSWVLSVAFSHGSKRIASGSTDGTIKIWDVATGYEAHMLKGHRGSVRSVAFSHDSKLIASGSTDGTIKIWDVATGHEAHMLEGHSSWVWSVAFSHDSKLLASGSGDTTIKIWDVTIGHEVHMLKGHSRSVQSVAFSHDSKLIASGSDDATIKIWDVAIGDDATIKIRDVATGHEVHMLKGHSLSVQSVVFSHNSKLIASGSNDGTIRIWDVATGHEVHILKGHSDWVLSVAFSHDSKLLASGSGDTTIKIWDVAIASGSDDATIKIRDVTIGHEVHMLKGHSDWVRSVAFSHDSKLIASGSDDKTIKIWDVATGHEVHMLKGHSGWVRSVAFSHDSKLIASGSDDKTIKIWDVATGHEVHMLNPVIADWGSSSRYASPRLWT
ncbi:unnamed protein product [Parascedosporium putredinis]|uniref:Mitochondrial division protein 1 n=1 Tax=Parascedosporium putredinis TaxID=1442378 RepID=A0A9P1M8K6_9PEZI|nr:unnamed protein product [Parascedosporium putredinis]CAI7990293.1 unnamed protein product [Parascedosporium putredinis]